MSSHDEVSLPGSRGPSYPAPPAFSAPALSHLVPARPGRRFLALLVDGVAYGVGSFVVILVLGLLVHLVGPAYWIAVAIVEAPVVIVVFVLHLWLVGTKGISPGKALLGLQVVGDPDGNMIGMLRALVRQLVFSLCSIPCGLGYLYIAFGVMANDPQGLQRGWHDRAARSRVIDRRAGDARPGPSVAPPPPPRMQQPPDVLPVPAPGPPLPQQPAEPSALAAEPAEAPAPPLPGAPVAGGLIANVPGFAPPEPLPPEVEMTRMSRPRPVDPEPTPAATGPWQLAFDTGQSVQVEGFGLIGRAPEGRPGEEVAHVVAIDDPALSVSKTHASFAPTADGGLELTDRGSTNGVVVRRDGAEHPLAAGEPYALQAGDRVRLGEREMTVTRG